MNKNIKSDRITIDLWDFIDKKWLSKKLYKTNKIDLQVCGYSKFGDIELKPKVSNSLSGL